MNYEKSTVCNWYLKRMKKINKEQPNQEIEKETLLNCIGGLIIGILGLLMAITVLSISMFIERPVRMIFSRGKITHKIRSWFRSWKEIYIGFKGGEI